MGLAANRACRGVTTIATFTATTEAAPWIVRPIVPDRFANIDRVASLRAPLLIAHGDADTVIPFAMGEALRDRGERLAKPGAFLHMPGIGHSPAADRMRRILASSIAALDAGRAGAFTDGYSGAAIGFGPWRVD
jgi:pimeloyl-ACP methyl ester carboxylesterase